MHVLAIVCRKSSFFCTINIWFKGRTKMHKTTKVTEKAASIKADFSSSVYTMHQPEFLCEVSRRVCAYTVSLHECVGMPECQHYVLCAECVQCVCSWGGKHKPGKIRRCRWSVSVYLGGSDEPWRRENLNKPQITSLITVLHYNTLKSTNNIPPLHGPCNS